MTATLPPTMFELDPSEHVLREPRARARRDDPMPPPMFDVDAGGELTPPVFDYSGAGYGPTLTPYGRHHGLGPGVFGAPFCDAALYGSIESLGHRAWIYHLCPVVGAHDEHHCDRCPVTWPTEGPAHA